MCLLGTEQLRDTGEPPPTWYTYTHIFGQNTYTHKVKTNLKKKNPTSQSYFYFIQSNHKAEGKMPRLILFLELYSFLMIWI